VRTQEGLFAGIFGRGGVDTGDTAWLQAMLDAEAALARVLERAGLAAPGAGAEVTAAAHADAFDDELLDVGLGAIEVGLDDDADRVAQLGLGMNAADDVQGDLGEGGVFHVNADKVAERLGMLSQALGDFAG